MRVPNPSLLASLLGAAYLLAGAVTLALPPDYVLLRRCTATMDERFPGGGAQWQIGVPFVSIQLANGTGGWLERHNFKFDTYAFCNGPNGYAEYGTGDDICMGSASTLPGALVYTAPNQAPDALSGTFSLTDSPSGDYASNLNITATINNAFDLTGYTNVSLVYFHHHALRWSNGNDAGRLEVSTNNGTTWDFVRLHNFYMGDKGQFKRADIPLSQYVGQTIRIRLRFTTDGSSSDDGWFVDDVRVLADGTTLFFDDFESGTGNWTLTGAWGLSLANYTYNNTLGSISAFGASTYVTTPVTNPVTIGEGMGFAAVRVAYTEDNVTRTAHAQIHHTAPQFKAAIERGYDNLCANTGTCATTSVADQAAPPQRHVVLDQNNPNPFNPTTDISFQLPADSGVSLRIYDEGGRLVRTLLDETAMPAGEHGLSWNGLDAGGLPVGSGVYFYELQVNGHPHTRKMVLLK